MKRRIVTALILFSTLFLVSGAYIILTMERSLTTVDNLIKLHRVELMREQLLLDLKRAQSDLYLKNTRYARNMDTVVTHVQNVDSAVRSCFGCHHTDKVTRQLEELQDRVEQYKDALNRVFTIRANQSRLAAEEDVAFTAGGELINEVNAITNLTHQKLEERTQAALKNMARTKIILYLLLAATPIVALSFSIVFVRGFTKPVDALLTATRRLKGGDLDYRITGLRDEYGEVASSFNDMAASLKQHYAKMQWAEQAIVLGQMAGGLAHEMRNPLAGIKGSLEVLSYDSQFSQEKRDILLEVIKQAERIEGLLDNLLNFARPPKPHLMPVDINDVLDATITFARNHPLFLRAESREIALVKQLGSGLPKTMADPLQLQQVFMNLLLNAADALSEGGELTVCSSHEPSSKAVHISISDSGNGIDPKVFGKIFLPFFTTKPKGTGLGLAITKRLVEQHGGTIRAESVPGHGASFTITLPLHSDDDLSALTTVSTERTSFQS